MLILSGKEPSAALKANIRQSLSETGITPSLVIMKVGHDPASDVYVRNKVKACDEVGIHCEVREFDEHIQNLALINEIERVNKDQSVHGIMVQLPLPAHLNDLDVLSAIDPKKDVDGLHPLNAGHVFKSDGCGYIPCTPLGILTLLCHYQINVAGKHVVIVGRSDIVGKPLAALMLAHDATVTVCHSKTKNLAKICRQADILVTAIGKPKFFTKEYVGRNAVVVDVGINRDENGKLCGDVDLDSIQDIAVAATPVPGGVGLMTVASLMYNCVRAVGEV